MKPYYQDSLVTIYHGDCREVMRDVRGDALVISDPPYNIGYHYAGYSDSLSAEDYGALLKAVCRPPCVILHYAESLFAFASLIGEVPEKCAAWVYNANTPRQWRMVAWFGITPDFKLATQPYKNLTDRRVQALIAGGSEGRALYDWWNVEQVKNVSPEKTSHPCQIPLAVMQNIIRVTPSPLIVDPFCGSGSTLRAAKDLGRRAVGIEIDERYCEIAAERCRQETLFTDVA